MEHIARKGTRRNGTRRKGTRRKGTRRKGTRRKGTRRKGTRRASCGCGDANETSKLSLTLPNDIASCADDTASCADDTASCADETASCADDTASCADETDDGTANGTANGTTNDKTDGCHRGCTLFCGARSTISICFGEQHASRHYYGVTTNRQYSPSCHYQSSILAKLVLYTVSPSCALDENRRVLTPPVNAREAEAEDVWTQGQGMCGRKDRG
jgi:hypothetical protein